MNSQDERGEKKEYETLGGVPVAGHKYIQACARVWGEGGLEASSVWGE